MASIAAPATLPRRFDGSRLVFGVAVAGLAMLVAPPLIWLAYTALAGSGGLALGRYGELAGDPLVQRAVVNSALLGLGGSGFAALLGVPLAWLAARTNLPLRASVRVAMVAGLGVPPFLSALAWILLAGPNAGLLNVLFKSLTGSPRGLFDIFSMLGLIFVVGLQNVPLTFMVVSSALQSMPTDVEESSRLLGAGMLATARRVTIPLVLPAILAGFTLSFAESITEFGVPAMIGLPGRTVVLTTRIWAMFQYPPHIDLAAGMGLPLLLFVGLLLWLQRFLLGRRSYALLSGKPQARRLVQLGRWRLPLAVLTLLVVLCVVVLPVLMVLAASLGVSANQTSGLTFRNYQFVLFSYGATTSAVTNSLLLGLLTASLATGLGAAVAYVARRRLVPASRLLTALASVPLAIPAVVLAVGLFALYTKPPVVLYGTIWILFLAYLTKSFPLAFNISGASLKSVGAELDDAARIGGARQADAFRDVDLPLMRSSLVTAWLFVFIAALRELSASILLFTSNSRVIPVAIYDLYESSRLAETSVLAVLIIAISFGVLLIARTFGGVNQLQARG